jgi:hypothetical protein
MEARQEEVVALSSIFGDDVLQIHDECNFTAEFPSIGARPSVKVHIVLPDSYPETSPPVVVIESPVLDESMIQRMVHELEERMFSPGEVVCFDYLSWVNDEFESLILDSIPKQVVDELSRKVKPEGQEQIDMDSSSSVGALQSDDDDDGIFHGELFVEKKSKFQAHVAWVHDVDDVKRVMDRLLTKSNKIQNATHNIMAYRIASGEDGQGSVVYQDFDDDGEAAAGKRLLHLLQVMDARNVLVVVSRWFGGILLGPSRFQCINNTARVALEAFLNEQQATKK